MNGEGGCSGRSNAEPSAFSERFVKVLPGSLRHR
jgi:hypothetical protein